MDQITLRKQIDGTIEHVKKVFDNILKLAFDPKDFGNKYSVDPTRIPMSPGDTEYLAVLALAHDLWKPLSGVDHADRGANFLSDPKNIAAVRFHDRFGIVHTGEASILFLDELAIFLQSITVEESHEFLSHLRLLTIVDVAAYGYLNQARVNTYEYLVGLLKEAGQHSDLEQLARRDTKLRVKRLLEANNRVQITDDALSKALAGFDQKQELENLLVTCRFDYGAYSFEPLFRELIRKGSAIGDTNVTKVGSPNPIHVFLHCLFDVLVAEGHTKSIVTVQSIQVGTRKLTTYDMSPLSIKKDPNNSEFRQWVDAYRTLL